MVDELYWKIYGKIGYKISACLVPSVQNWEPSKVVQKIVLDFPPTLI
jgi:hypothetical protein